MIEAVVRALKASGRRVVFAESCTAGLVSAAVASVPGASAVLWGSFACYTPDAKDKMLGVEPELISLHGAVSKEVAAAMAEGALKKSSADISLAITGLAGPDGDGTSVPVGTVILAVCRRGETPETRALHFFGDRAAVRLCARNAAIELLFSAVS